MKANDCIQRPIRLNNNTVVVMHLFSRTSELIEMWLHDEGDYIADNYSGDLMAAKLFIEQLQGQWNMRFMIALRDEANTIIEEWEKNKSKLPEQKK